MQQWPLEEAPKWKESASPNWPWSLPLESSTLHSLQTEPARSPRCRWCRWEPWIWPVIVSAQLPWCRWTQPLFLHRYRCLAKCGVQQVVLHQWSPRLDHCERLEPALVLQFRSTFRRWTEMWRPARQMGMFPLQTNTAVESLLNHHRKPDSIQKGFMKVMKTI